MKALWVSFVLPSVWCTTDTGFPPLTICYVLLDLLLGCCCLCSEGRDCGPPTSVLLVGCQLCYNIRSKESNLMLQLAKLQNTVNILPVFLNFLPLCVSYYLAWVRQSLPSPQPISSQSFIYRVLCHLFKRYWEEVTSHCQVNRFSSSQNSLLPQALPKETI